VVIGATNRVDALDGALRRPGRFDRELLFPLPSQPARAEILAIHTRGWAPPPSPALLADLAAATPGHAGADLRALCTEAALAALRRRYPQIYESEAKLEVVPGSVVVERADFVAALAAVTPAAHRAAGAPARPLPGPAAPALAGHLQAALAQLARAFPPAATCLREAGGGAPARGGGGAGAGAAPALAGGAWAAAPRRPRLLVAGPPGCGQAHLGPALLHALEGLPHHGISLPALLSDPGARSPEEALVHAVAEARRAAPAVLFLPHLQAWWETAPGSLRAVLWALLADLPPDLPLLLLATADAPARELDPEALALFGAGGAGEAVYETAAPTAAQRAALFAPAARALAGPPEPEIAEPERAAPPPALPLAPGAAAAEAAAAATAAAAAARARFEADQAVMRALRMALRAVASRLLAARRWEAHAEPVSPDDDPGYYARVAAPMDLATLLDRVDRRRYTTPAAFLADVDLIPAAERAYWGDAPAGLRHVSRACALADEARELVAAAVPPGSRLAEALAALAARGGAAAPPPGEDGATLGAGGDGFAVGAGAAGVAGGGGGGDDARRPSRRSGAADVDERIIHQDPEAERRRMLRLRQAEARAAAAAAAEAGGAAAEPVAAKPAEAAAEGGALQEAAAPAALAPERAPPPAPAASAGRLGRRSSAAAAAPVEEAAAAPAEEAAAAPAEGGEEGAPLAPADRRRVDELARALAQRTGGRSLEALEGLLARLGRLAEERRRAPDREAAAAAALAAADVFLARLDAA
jgi:SpoVK/Ycf46/Vps4 family AAA+-type ATPase